MPWGAIYFLIFIFLSIKEISFSIKEVGNLGEVKRSFLSAVR